jgi:hypothetical protein
MQLGGEGINVVFCCRRHSFYCKMGSRSIPRSRLKIITAITAITTIFIIITWTLDAQTSSSCCKLLVVDPFFFFVYFLPCSSHRYNSRWVQFSSAGVQDRLSSSVVVVYRSSFSWLMLDDHISCYRSGRCCSQVAYNA